MIVIFNSLPDRRAGT